MPLCMTHANQNAKHTHNSLYSSDSIQHASQLSPAHNQSQTTKHQATKQASEHGDAPCTAIVAIVVRHPLCELQSSASTINDHCESRALQPLQVRRVLLQAVPSRALARWSPRCVSSAAGQRAVPHTRDCMVALAAAARARRTRCAARSRARVHGLCVYMCESIDGCVPSLLTLSIIVGRVLLTRLFCAYAYANYCCHHHALTAAVCLLA